MKKIFFIIFLIIIILLIPKFQLYAYNFTINGNIIDNQSSQPFNKQYVYIHDRFGIIGEKTVYTDENGFYSVTFNLSDIHSNVFIIQTYGFCENFWIPYIKEVSSIDGIVNVDFAICHNPIGLQQTFFIDGFVKDLTTLLPFENHKVTITENYKPNQQKVLYTDNNGYYSAMFTLPPLYNVDFVIETDGNCNSQWITYSDTTRNINGTYSKNFSICHNPLWFNFDFWIEGYVFDESSNTPMQQHEVFIISKSPQLTINKIFTDNTGYYSKKFTISELDTNIFEIKTFSYCDNEWTFYKDSVRGFEGTFQKDFYICPYNQADIICKVLFDYEVDTSSNSVSFYEISLDDITSRYWTLGDGYFSSNQYFTYTYQNSGVYNVCLNITTDDNCLNSYCQNINVGRTYNFSGNIFAGENLVPEGKALLYRYLENKFKLTDFTDIVSGSFAFDSVFEGSYSVYAVPFFDYDFIYFPKYFPTYLSSALNWQNENAIYVNHNILNQNISLEKYSDVYYGNGTISGEIFYDISSGNDLNNFEINVLLYNEENNAIAFSTLDSDRKFIFKNLPFGEYKVYPENAEKNTFPIYVTLNSDNKNIENVNFTVYDNFIDTKVNISDEVSETNKIRIFPNPFENEIFIKSTVLYSQIEIYNLTGTKIFSRKVSENQSEINLNCLLSGIYLIVIKNNNTIIYTQKIIKY